MGAILMGLEEQLTTVDNRFAVPISYWTEVILHLITLLGSIIVKYWGMTLLPEDAEISWITYY